MSGFVGILNGDGAPADAQLLQHLSSAMSYCGPDGRHVWVDGSVGLGHVLLGPVAAPKPEEKQPCSLDGQVWIAGDIRIDGRSELEARLREAGAKPPPTASGAHLVLHAYAAWGPACTQYLVGDFAFAIWDGRRRRLFCARDHFGVVPFYYVRRSSNIIFGNVLWSIRAHPGVPGTLDERAVGDYLMFGVNMDPTATFFADVRTLSAGNTLTVEDGAVSVRPYWEPPQDQDPLRLRHPNDLVEQFRDLFCRAVGDRLMASTAGTHLSGGMDSTSIAATAKQVLAERGDRFDLRAYTIVFDRLMNETERQYTDLAAEAIGLPLEHLVAEDYLMLPPVSANGWVFPEPGVVPTQSAHYEISRRVASFSRTLLSGHGGDPLFRFTPVAARTPGDWWRKARFEGATGSARQLLAYGARPVRRSAPPAATQGLALPDWVDPDFARRADLPERWAQVHSDWPTYTGPRAMLHPTWQTMFARAHPGSAGLTVRVVFPFFDLRVAQFVWKASRYQWRADKRLLRESMFRNLPPEILARPKSPMYVASANRGEDDPEYRLTLDKQVQAWQSEAMKGDEIGQFIVRPKALEMIANPVAKRSRPLFSDCASLAFWLQSLAKPYFHSITLEEPENVDPPTR